MANNTISQVEINGTTYDLLDANTLSAVSALDQRVTSLESSVDKAFLYTNYRGSTQNINNLIDNGIYSINGGTNNPTDSYVALLVVRMDNNPNFVIQLAISCTYNHIYYRRKHLSNWYPWITVI